MPKPSDFMNNGGKLLLVHCPTFNFENFDPEVLLNRGYYAYPPRALMCLQTALRSIVESEILDLNFLMLQRLQEETGDLYAMLIKILEDYLKSHPEINIYGISTGVIVPTIFETGRHPFLEVLKYLMERGNALIIAGGAAATIEARNLIEGGWCHIVIKGEAEDKLKALFMGQKTGGIGYLENGKYAETNGPLEMVNFKQSLIPSYQDIPVENYHKTGCLSPFSRMAGADLPYCTIQLIRGCRMKCTFCGLSQYRGSNQVCEYPQEMLFDEIRYLAQERGIRHFSWLDEDLLAAKEEVKEILRQIIRHKLNITWSAPTGLITMYVDEELLKLAEQSGCTGFRIGIESGNPEMLRQVRKPGTVSGFRRIGKLIQHHPKLFVCGLYMLGFEGERYGQMFDTLRFAIELNLSWSHFSVYQEIAETNLAKPTLSAYRDWLPSPQKVTGASRSSAAHGQLNAKDILALPADRVHDPALRQELWFAFNLIANYISNKNLKADGNLDHFIRWTRGLQANYPHHPVISLFLALAYRMDNNRIDGDQQYQHTVRNMNNYWTERFKSYGLDRLMSDYPISDVPKALSELCQNAISSPELHAVLV